MYIITRSKGSTPLNGICENDLPETGKLKYNDDTMQLEGVYTDKRILDFRSDCYITFSSQNEAQEYIQYMARVVEENRDRYEHCIKGSTNKLLKTIASLKVKMVIQ